ncbi:hypothetical protein CGCSCA5_v014352 [Colletotrichum siamense]|nr:hypothetical protein CGCSCA5_v014352 [Colletotrichum siamense]
MKDPVEPRNVEPTELVDAPDNIVYAEGTSEPLNFSNLTIIPINKPREEIFFFKRMEGSNARFDAMVQVGGGELRPDAEEAGLKSAIWEVIDGVYLYRRAGLSFKVLQSVGSAEYTSPERSFHRVKHIFSLKTCALLANRDVYGGLQVLKLALSGDTFDLARPKDHGLVVHHPRWIKRVKHIADLLGLEMGSPYSGHSMMPTEDDVADWAAGHAEKKLAAYTIYAMLKLYVFGDRIITHVSIADLQQLKSCLRKDGLAPRFEIHLSHKLCGVLHESGKCVPFVQRLGYLTGIDFAIYHWENGVILDGIVPARTGKKETTREACADGGREDTDIDDYNSEVDDLELTLAEKYPDDWGAILRSGLDDVGPQGAHLPGHPAFV